MNHSATTTSAIETPSTRTGEPEASWQSGSDWAHRYGLALIELLEHLPTDHLHGKVAATVVVTLNIDQLTNDVRAAHLDTGHDISAATARRLACNAGIVPVVLGGKSQILDAGRTSRFFTEAQRTALATVYDTCAAANCDRPYAWTELHHLKPGRATVNRTWPMHYRCAGSTTAASTIRAMTTASAP